MTLFLLVRQFHFLTRMFTSNIVFTLEACALDNQVLGIKLNCFRISKCYQTLVLIQHFIKIIGLG